MSGSVDGSIVQVSDSSLRVSILPPATCSACLDGRGCGAGLLRRAGKPLEITIGLSHEHQRDFQIGERVRVRLSDAGILPLSSLAYGLPLLGLLCGVSLTSVFGPVANAIAGVSGALFGVLLARALSGRLGIRGHVNPSIVE
ncbi:MAG: SoxR reducing system RseC family protein [Woeseiaceae bacterium]